jgi:hypothetical protein
MPFINWCKEHNGEARIQPCFRFTNEFIQGAGVTPRPEMEVTTERFAVVLNPRKAVAAGAHLYDRRIVFAEAFTRRCGADTRLAVYLGGAGSVYTQREGLTCRYDGDQSGTRSTILK